ncbi:hypothetical protein [Aquimarina megaterium]|uniref:hypothetical protein n=1 Tax=Aquimarina megaterium TaxID=1443666 RepID=UPI0004703D53|nr:hypothetical protein [Aquimarina megaterium]
MKIIIVFTVVLLGLVSCKKNDSDLICERINYLVDTKSNVAKKYWKDFDKQLLFGPMLYYTKDGLFTIDANEALKEKINLVAYNCDDSNVSVGFTPIIDTTNFYMNVSYEDKNTSALEYKNTLGMFSDVELTEKFITDVKDTEEWMTMVIHEIFHQYQKKFKKFREKQMSSQRDFDRDTLNYFFKNENWFTTTVKNENQLLLKIIQEDNNDSVKNYISGYLKSKEQRYARIKNEFRIDISALESSLSKSEGTARYIEYCTKLALSTSSNNHTLSEIDNKYVANRFKDYNLKQDEWMYNLGGGYYYSLGFNLTRVLEKLKIKYQEDIFIENKSFDQYLKEYLE